MLTCFAGCDLDSILAALGLARRDLFDGELPPGYTPPPRREPSPWDPVTQGPGIDHLLHRMKQQERDECDPAYWRRVADEAEAAPAKPGSYPGRSTPQQRAALKRRCVERAAACRRHAALLESEHRE